MIKEEFIKAGFTVIEGNENKQKTDLLDYIRTNYPQIIKDGELNINELKTVLDIPVNLKENGYGLNFIGRNIAKRKYAEETKKCLKINEQFSKNFDATHNLVLKGDNLDCLKILTYYYSGQIKMIYIDPPYNTNSDKFLYPDKFGKEEQEVLKLSGLSDDDIERLEFSFKTPKSHNGWLTFMYPRLKLAKDLLSDEGVIFISIDDNEQANLKLLCDDIFGENNFVTTLHCQMSTTQGMKVKAAQDGNIVKNAEYILCYSKNGHQNIAINPLYDLRPEYDEHYSLYLKPNGEIGQISELYDFRFPKDCNNKKPFKLSEAYNKSEQFAEIVRSHLAEIVRSDKITGFDITKDLKSGYWKEVERDGKKYFLTLNNKGGLQQLLRLKDSWGQTDGYYPKEGLRKIRGDWWEGFYIDMGNISKEGDIIFKNGKKPIRLIKQIIKMTCPNDTIVLDFFAGSGTTGHAVMQLNSEDNGNRKFILCQIDEDIDKNKNKEAYQFCIDNNLPPCISSITCERLNRAGNKINKGDTGYKVFDLVQKPHLNLDKNGQMEILENNLTPIDRIYNLIAQIGIDCPDTAPKEILKDCMYLYENNGTKNYYITNSGLLDNIEGKKLFKEAISNGNIYIDGWTATLNTTLQEQKDNIKIIF